MIIPEQFRVIDNQSVRVTFGLEIRVEIFHLEGDVITLHDRVFVTWPMTSFCPKTLKKEKSTYVSVMTFRIIEMGRPNDSQGF